MLVLHFTSCEDLGKVNSLHFNSVLVDAVDAQPPYCLRPPEFPALHMKYLLLSSPLCEVCVQATGVCSTTLSLHAEVCGEVGELILWGKLQPMADGRHSSRVG